jgi:hypothetical protein
LQQKQKEEKTTNVINQLQKKEFKDSQEARRFYGALKILLPKIKKVPIGWRCNFTDTVHPGGPRNVVIHLKVGNGYLMNIKQRNLGK